MQTVTVLTETTPVSLRMLTADERARFDTVTALAPVQVHQPRENAVRCQGGCGGYTWEVHAVCTSCGPKTCDLCRPTGGASA
jgi:hypothetical protein